MSDAITKTMLAAYRPESAAHRFFTSLCNIVFFKTDLVEIDIERDDEEVAIAITNLEDPGRQNTDDLYTNKEFTPPIFKERLGIQAARLLSRLAGNTAYDSVEFQAAASAKAMKGGRKLEKKIVRAVERMAAEVFQTGMLTIRNAAGTPIMALDFKPKAAHFPTAGTLWSNAAAPALDQLEDLADTILQNGKVECSKVLMGRTAMREFLNLTQVKEKLDLRRLEGGGINKPKSIAGATYHGDIVAGSYSFEIWGYKGWFKDPATGLMTRYLGDDKVVMWSEGTRVTAAFGEVPVLPTPAQSAAVKYLPPRLSNPAGSDMRLQAWVENDGQSLTVQASSRPVVFPEGIDTFGCLST